MAILLDGKRLSDEILLRHASCVDALEGQDVYPALTVLTVGDDPASAVYARNKEKACRAAGILSTVIALPSDVTQQALEARIACLNEDQAVHGILLELPLPRHLDARAALSRIAPDKDVDGQSESSAGRLFLGQEGFIPCTAKGILRLLKAYNVPLAGKNAVVIGRSNIVGKPVAHLLLRENCTVTVAHSQTQALPALTRGADIVVCAVGKPCFLTADMVKDGAAVIDVGINRVNGRTVGDVDFDAVSQKAGWITPVPGGVGKMTVCMLIENTLEAACKASR